MSDTIQTVSWGFVLRVAQALLEGAPTLLCGLLVAGIFRRMLGPANTLRLFGSNTWRSLPQAWALGMLLPVCSLGIFPVLREMRRAGVSGGAVLAFALAAPLFNPLSFLYGLTLSDPSIIFAFTLGSLIVVTVVGLLWDRLFPHSALEPPADRPVAPGAKRLTAVVVHAAREWVGPTAGYVLIALLGVGLVSAVLPFGILQTTMNHHEFPDHAHPLWSPLIMLAIGLPVYLSPMKAMGQVGLMFDHGNSVGAALVLLILGAGMNLGLLAWVGWNYGLRRLLTWLCLTVGLVLALGYAVEQPLYPRDKVEENHTHAFDDYCCPFPTQLGASGHQVWAKLEEKSDYFEWVGLAGLAGLALLGIGLRFLDPRESLDEYLERPEAVQDGPKPLWNRQVPAPVLAAVALVGLVVFSVIGCYLYYPPPVVVFEEMSQIRAELHSALLKNNKEEAMRHIRRYDDLTRRLEVGVFLRTWKMDAQAHEATEGLRLALEEVYDELKDGNLEEARRLEDRIYPAHVRVREAFSRAKAHSE